MSGVTARLLYVKTSAIRVGLIFIVLIFNSSYIYDEADICKMIGLDKTFCFLKIVSEVI